MELLSVYVMIGKHAHEALEFANIECARIEASLDLQALMRAYNPKVPWLVTWSSDLPAVARGLRCVAAVIAEREKDRDARRTFHPGRARVHLHADQRILRAVADEIEGEARKLAEWR